MVAILTFGLPLDMGAQGSDWRAALKSEQIGNARRIQAIDEEAEPLGQELFKVLQALKIHDDGDLPKPSNDLAVEAYNREADQLDAQKERLESRLKILEVEQDRLLARNKEIDVVKSSKSKIYYGESETLRELQKIAESGGPGHERYDSKEPGGISFSSAVASGMQLDLDFDSIYYDKGSIILSGRTSHRPHQFDAALFLTALRLSCESDDPYFSLDTIPGKEEEMVREYDQMADEIHDHFKFKANYFTDEEKNKFIALKRKSPNRGKDFIFKGPRFTSFTVYDKDRKFYRSLVKKYPNFRSLLVFRPEWLRKTRFGEILFHADVLLKELTSGTPILNPHQSAPVNNIENYVSQDLRHVIQGLLELLEGKFVKKRQDGLGWHRLWLDFSETEEAVSSISDDPLHRALHQMRTLNKGDLPRRALHQIPTFNKEEGDLPRKPPSFKEGIRKSISRAVRRELRKQGVIRKVVKSPSSSPNVYHDGEVQDLSEIFPVMFVRRHDPVKNEDLPGTAHPFLQSVATDVNGRFGVYAHQYQVLRDLIYLFRAYLAARNISDTNRMICDLVQDLPFYSGELLEEPLPEFYEDLFAYHNVSLAVLHVTQNYQGKIDYEPESFRMGVVTGGVTLNLSRLRQKGRIKHQETLITKEFRRAISFRPRNSQIWVAKNGDGRSARKFINLSFDFQKMVKTVRGSDSSDPIAKKGVLQGRKEPHIDSANQIFTFRSLKPWLVIVFGDSIAGSILGAIIFIIIVSPFVWIWEIFKGFGKS